MSRLINLATLTYQLQHELEGLAQKGRMTCSNFYKLEGNMKVALAYYLCLSVLQLRSKMSQITGFLFNGVFNYVFSTA
jgi:hypothetical protein